ncbi:MAG: YicC family protein [Clostridia bacterium]|nr:YicC family protein [Clostridia bacterium]
MRMRSMTGYGKGVYELDGNKLTIELRAVNHKALDLGIKLPRILLFLEDSIRKQIQQDIFRGHIDVLVNFEQSEQEKGLYKPNSALAESWINSVALLHNKYPNLQNDVTLSTLARVPDVISREETESNDESLQKLCNVTLGRAIDALVQMREREGLALKKDLNAKLDEIESYRQEIEKYAPTVVENYRKKLTERIEQVVSPNVVDQNLLATEIALYADHVAIDEELTRLKIHVENMKKDLEETKPIGRDIEFLVQELNRETNTIGSKAQCIEITNIVLKIKNVIEKIREQAANIE